MFIHHHLSFLVLWNQSFLFFVCSKVRFLLFLCSLYEKSDVIRKLSVNYKPLPDVAYHQIMTSWVFIDGKNEKKKQRLSFKTSALQ